MTVRTREMTRMSMMAALTVISSFIVIPLGPVAITLQTLFVLLTGLLFLPNLAFYTQLLAVVMTVLLKGPQIILGPSFGFLLSFIVVAMLIAWLKTKKGWKNLYLLVLIGIGITYLIGTPYMAFVLNYILNLQMTPWQILYSGVFIFLPGDLLKAFLAILVYKSINRVLI